MRRSSDLLLELLREHALQRGDFLLASGRRSEWIIDCKQAVLTAKGHALVAVRMFDAVASLPRDVAAVAGVALGGCPLASSVSLLSWQRSLGFFAAHDAKPIDAVYVRKSPKDHGTARLVEGHDHLPRGTPVALLEDVVTTGGSVLRTVEVLREAGLEVAGVAALVDRVEGGREAIEAAGFDLVACYTRHDFLP